MVARDPVRWRDVPAALWSRRTYVAMAQLVTGGVIWVLTTGAMLGAVGLVASKTGPLTVLDPTGYGKTARLVAALILLPVVPVALLAMTARLTAWQRIRFRAVLGVELLPFAPYRPDRRRWRRLAADAVDRRAWAQVAYHATAGLLSAATVTALTGMGLGITLLLGESIGRHRPPPSDRVFMAATGVGLILAAPWLARGAAAVDLALGRALLQPPATEELARRVESLSASRAGAVDAADAERRRIERSLHDGTQQRLVSLAMNLGMTRAALGDARPEVHQAIAKAHEEAKQALAELRDFIRGLHPAVLDELGLDAALSGLAARSPVPVRLTVDLGARPPAAAEAVAYFVVSEALANVARHAGATRTDVAVRQQPGGLFLSVTDDGHGGADPRRGTGLRGLQQRVESLDGTLRIASPTGGPTSIQVTLPCAW